MLQIIEFTYTDDPVEIILWFENIIIQNKFKVIYNTVVKILPVATVIDTVQPGRGQTPFTDLAIAVNHNVPRTEQTVIVKCYDCWNLLFS